jgi:hypothetical protein
MNREEMFGNFNLALSQEGLWSRKTIELLDNAFSPFLMQEANRLWFQGC